MLSNKYKESLKNNYLYYTAIIICIIIGVLKLLVFCNNDFLKNTGLFFKKYFMVGPIILVNLILIFKNRKSKNDAKDLFYILVLLLFGILLFYSPF